MNALEKAIADINRKYKSELVRVGTEIIYSERIEFSSPRANYLTYGGIPIGKATEFFGSEGGGKTTSALDITAQAQRKEKAAHAHQVQQLQQDIDNMRQRANKTEADKLRKLEDKLQELNESGHRRVVYVDAENTLDTEWAAKLGVDTDDLILIRPHEQTAEQVLQMMLDLLDTGQVALMVLDSVPMLVSQNLYDESLEKKAYAGIAGALTEFSRKVSSRISKHRSALLLINQLREDLDNPYNQYNTPGGKALKHLFALRLYFRKGSFFDENGNEQPNRFENPAGNMVDMTIVKTKICKPDRRAGQYTLNYTDGIDVVNDAIFLAVKYNIIRQSGAWYYLIDETDDGELKFQGKSKLQEFLKRSPDIYNQIAKKLAAATN